MNRLEAIKEYLTPYIIERIHEKIEAEDNLQKDSLIPSVASLVHRALERQEKQPQWKPSYIGLFHLMASLITGSYEYELMIADRQMYLDEYQVIGHWRPHFFYQDAREEEYVRKILGKQFIRLNSYEISYAERYMFYEYRSVAGVYWKEHLDEVIKLEDFRKMSKDIPFQFLFGDYMGDMHTVLNYEEVL